MPTALLTGGTGFLGYHTARALLSQGWKVKALARKRPRRVEPALLRLPIELIQGGLLEESALSAASAGCDAIVHAAGLVKARTFEDYREVNARGTERLLRAARASAPEALFLLVSSQAAAGPARGDSPVSEQDPARPVSWYGTSKKEAEEALRREWKGPWIILRPGVLYGPGDRGLLSYFRMAAAGRVPVPAARSRIQIGSGQEAAFAIARAASRKDLHGRTGFLCDPEPVTVRDLAGTIASLPPRVARLVRVPDLLVRLAGLAETLRETVTRKSRPFNADKAREILAGDWLCDSGPMRRDLALPAPRPLAEGLRNTWEWYVDAGWLSSEP